jgi:hypothetical protein
MRRLAGRMHLHRLLPLVVLAACIAKVQDSGASEDTADTSGDTDTAGTTDDTAADTDTADTDTASSGSDPFADAIVSFSPGAFAGYGQDDLPDVVLGSPEGGGTSASLDVLSLGQEGEIVLELDDIGIVDGDGADLLVFENPFPGWYETGVVAVSDDGTTWAEWPCDATDAEGGYPGCAGVALVYAASDNDVDATDPDAAGGDRFDLADVGLSSARFVRIRDSGANTYEGTSAGFDLDAIAVVNGAPL